MNILSHLPDRKFLKQSLTLSSATLFSQVFSFIASLVLFRIYTPVEYGKFGIFITVSSLLSLIGTGQLQHAVFISESRKETEQLISLMILSCLLTSALAGLILYILYGQVGWISFNAIYLLPLSILSGGFFFFMSALSITLKEFDLLSSQKIYGAILGPLISIGIGIWYRDVIGLVCGFLLSQLFSVLLFYNKLAKEFHFKFKIHQNEIRAILIKFKNFPLFTLPSELINALVNQLPLILLGQYYSLQTVGYYKMATTILNLPVGAISVPIGALFKQQVAEALTSIRSCKAIYLKSTRLLILTGGLPFLILGLTGSRLLTLIFGLNWQPAGVMVQILSGLYFAKFVVSPLTSVTQLTGHQKFALWFNIFLLAITYGVFYWGHQTGGSYLELLTGYAILYGSLYLLTYIICLKFCSHDGQA